MKAYIMDKSRSLRIADVEEPAKHADNQSYDARVKRSIWL